jgi:hypothetical protein
MVLHGVAAIVGQNSSPGIDFYNTDSAVTVCQMVQHGVAAIVGPNDASVAAHVQSMAEVLKVPHIETRWRSFSVNNLVSQLKKIRRRKF